MPGITPAFRCALQGQKKKEHGGGVNFPPPEGNCLLPGFGTSAVADQV